MAIKAGKVLRTATAAARKFQGKQFSGTPLEFQNASPVSHSSGVGTFLGIPKPSGSETDLLISKFIRLYQTRVAKKGDFTEKNVKKMLSGKDTIGINETSKLLEGKTMGESSKQTKQRSH
ncbi:hypothetical protein V5N11_031246 [Cardamine amara subsp. amara]|uniref:Uncharacterized protein n=1 Tax=Cardamine amara subsp. amara TaxID=228776 RepID=A0ABD1C3P4_CARAN